MNKLGINFKKKEKRRKQDNQRISFRCYVLYFLYIKEKAPKMTPKHKRRKSWESATFQMAEHVWMSAARMHADLIFDLWPLPALQGLHTLEGGWLSKNVL